jgi:DNA polymerase-1
MYSDIYKVVTTADLQELPNKLNKELPLSIDVEGGGENYETLTTIQMYQSNWDKVWFFELKDLPTFAPEFIYSLIVDMEWLGHNLMTEFKYFDSVVSHFVQPAEWFDTFYASRLVFPSWMEYSLDKCLTKLLGYDPYAKMELVKKDMQKSFQPNVPCTHEQYMYGSIDVYELPKLYEKTKQIKGNFNYELDKKIAGYSIDVHKKGMPVDRGELTKLMTHFKAEVARTKTIIGDVNVNSYIQVRRLLGLEYNSDELTLRIIANRPRGLTGHIGKTKNNPKNHILEPNYMHSEEVIQMANAVIDQRKALKRLNFEHRAYANGYEHEDGSWRVASRFSPHAITGRVQGQDENLSQYPRDLKSMWGLENGKDSDTVLLYADYSQLELRSICAMLGETAMEEAYRNEIDIHSYTADGLDFDESLMPEGVPKRFVAKQLNFLTLYGGGMGMFQSAVCKTAGVWLDMDNIVQPAVRAWKKRYPVIKAWQTTNGKSTTNMDKTMSGRWYKAKILPDLCSYSNQGSGAEVAKMAWHNSYKYGVVGNDSGVDLLNFVHDAFIWECPNDPAIYKPLAKKLAMLMQDGWFQITRQAKIKDLPMPVDVFVGHNWADMEYETDEVMHKESLEGMFMYEKDIEKELENVK